MSLQVRVWPDSGGRITRAQLVGSSGNPAVDQAIKNQVLTGLQLQAPPADMPVPIVLRLTARKSGL
jgi:protein TonB